MRKRFLAALLCLCMVVTLLPIAAFAAGDGTLTALDISKGAITIGENTVSGIDSDGNNVTTVDEDGYVITGTASGGNAITINGQPADSTIQLGTASAPLNITGSGVILYITANAKNVNLRVAGNVTLTSSGSPTLPLKSSASIEIAENASLTLNGSSSPALMVEDSAALNITGGGSFTANYTGNSAFTISAQAGSFSCTVGGDIAITNTNNTFEDVYRSHTIRATFIEESKVNPDTGVGNPFTDVKESDWFFEDVMFVYGNKLMLGTSDTTFSPNDTTTRAMVATILWRMEGSPKVTGSSGFTDVPEGKYYTDAIAWAKQNDLVNGYSKTLFGPNDPVTREQLAAFFYRYAQYKGYDTTITASISSFGDSDKVSPWAVDAMKWAVGYGILQGNTDNLLDPQGDATRAQLAAMLHRLIEKNELVEGVTTTGLMGWIDPRRLMPPQTGDSASSAIFFSAMLFSLGAATLCAVKLKRRKDGGDTSTLFPA